MFEDDISTIQRIDAVERILEVVCRTTGLGFSAVARVTDTQWIACAVRDPHPHEVAVPEVIATFELFAELISTHLDAQDRLAASETALTHASARRVLT